MFVSHPSIVTNKGLDWSKVNKPPPLSYPNGFALHEMAADLTHPYTAYAVVSAFTGGSKGHVWKTTDFGANWTDISGNLPNIPVDSIALSADGSTIYIGTDVGVFSSSDAGGDAMPPNPTSTHWAVFGAGLPNVQVVDLEVVQNAKVNLIPPGTHGRGMWLLSPPT